MMTSTITRAIPSIKSQILNDFRFWDGARHDYNAILLSHEGRVTRNLPVITPFTSYFELSPLP